MEKIRRKQYNTLLSRLTEPRHFIQVIAGPRQVGKSTMVNQVLTEINRPYTSLSADGIPTSNTTWIHEIWETARTEMAFNKEEEHILAIDEIHKIENWSDAVKSEWDRDTRENRNMKVILLGSSRLLLKNGLNESLMGRYEVIRMMHWSYDEMREAFGWDVNQYIYFGGFPGAAHLVEDESRWLHYVKDAIIEPSISRDVIQTSVIQKPALLRQLFELGCAYSAQILSMRKTLAHFSEKGSVVTMQAYLDVLGSSNLLCGLQKYAVDKARRYASEPKYQVFNNAFLTAYSGLTYKDALLTPKIWGRFAESAVGAHLASMAEENGYQLNYWRDGANEVDYIVSNGKTILAIEVKAGADTKHTGLSVFGEKYKHAKSIIVGTSGIALDKFLASDISVLL